MIQHRATAVYEGGVFKPTRPVPIPDGARVELVVSVPLPPGEIDNSPEAVELRRQKVERLRQMYAEFDALDADEPDDGYDPLVEINNDRIRRGARPILPPDGAAS
ncbi:MAG: DUF104 domain-containing protein [Gemmataceae bacterium]|nr:DUF104 domain-containing protein [Gemmataceae bacterium]